MTIYGDGARFARSDSLELVTMSFLLVTEATWMNKYVLATIVKTAEKKPQTWTIIWAILKWSFECMFTGKHPATDHTGSLGQRGLGEQSWQAKTCAHKAASVSSTASQVTSTGTMAG